MSDYDVFWKNRDDGAGKAGTYCNAQNFGIIHPSVNAMYDQFIQPHTLSKTGFSIKASTYLKLISASGEHFVFGGETDFSVPYAEQRLDVGTSLQAGRDYYIYLCLTTNTSGETAADIVVSLNSTFPTGYTAYTSRKIGGFHTLCASVGVINGHALSGYTAGKILPASFWDLWHRPSCNPEGMVYIKELDIWADIYLQSGIGASTQSVNGGTTTDTRTYMDHVDDMAAVGKSLLSDEEFQVVAEGSNQQTNISGSANPVYTGGHSDTAGRRMISNYGLEDCCGALWQWVQGGGWMSDGTAWSTDWPGSKGQVYGSGKAGLLAGGDWSDGAKCGSRCRYANGSRVSVHANHGCRGRARSRVPGKRCL